MIFCSWSDAIWLLLAAWWFCTSAISSTGRASLTAQMEQLLSVADVDSRIQTVKIYVYTPPEAIKEALGLDQKAHEFYMYIEIGLLAMIQEKSGQYVTVVEDPLTADFFWVPHAMYAHQKFRNYTRTALAPFLDHIYHDLPYFNRSKGRDHIFVYVWDNGPICDSGYLAEEYQNHPTFRTVVHPMIIVGYHGMKGYRGDEGKSDIRQHCFKIGHDITLPMYNNFHLRPQPDPFSFKFLRRKAIQTQANMYFHGNAMCVGARCSIRLRHWILHYMRNCSADTPPLNTMAAACSATRTCIGHQNGLFALCPAGWGCWSSRFFDAIDRMLIPVIMADGIIEPYERWFDYSTFTTKVMTGNFTVTNGHNPLADQLYEQRQFPLMERLHDDANSFRRTCTPCSSNVTPSSCLKHPVSRKLKAMALHRPWFSWDIDAPRNALKLFILELFCRTLRGKRDLLCRKPGREDFIAYAEYGV